MNLVSTQITNEWTKLLCRSPRYGFSRSRSIMAGRFPAIKFNDCEGAQLGPGRLILLIIDVILQKNI